MTTGQSLREARDAWKEFAKMSDEELQATWMFHQWVPPREGASQ
jgi:hypothetical protein